MAAAQLTIPSNLIWVGLAKEATYGTAITAPTAWVPIDMSSAKYEPHINPLEDNGARGLAGAPFQQIAGMRYDTLSYKAFVYLDSAYQHVLAMYGKPDAITGSSDPYTHKTSLENGADQAQAQPMSFTLFLYDGLTCWQMPGCVAQSVKVDTKVDENATLEVTWMGLPAVQMGSAPTNTPTTAKPMPAWNGIVTIGGAAKNRYNEVAIEIKRDTADVPTINNSQTPIQIFGGLVTVGINLNAVFLGGASDPDVIAFLANTQTSLVVKLAPSGDSTHSLSLQHSVFAFKTLSPSFGSKWSEVASVGSALMNATDALDSKQSVGQAIMLNAVSTAY